MPAISSPLAQTVINASPVKKKLKNVPFPPEPVFSSQEVDGILESVKATPEKTAEQKESFEQFDAIKIPKLEFAEFEDELPVSLKEEVVESKVKIDINPLDSPEVMFKRESQEKLSKREKKEKKREKKEKKRAKEEKLEEKEKQRLLPIIKEESVEQTVQSPAFTFDKPSQPNRKQKRQKLAQATPIKHPMSSQHTAQWSSPTAQLYSEYKSSSPASRKKKDKKHKGKQD